ncbi:hypothetical protein NLG97_g8204 [Lecanicillium saksenae]|uniref:Uncharacterized protein n=1 Tax=Lecanicillium saksenae TaxID=468837 RepID=A0ACC1QJN7_9HYPO|nr:hypothetical protein NLG97_g8204 [Lecanicillium saksenae]
MPGGKIDVYLDFASLFSYVAFADLQANRQKLAANGVTIEYHPVFLGGINVASGMFLRFLPTEDPKLTIFHRQQASVGSPCQGRLPHLRLGPRPAPRRPLARPGPRRPHGLWHDSPAPARHPLH